MEDEKARGLSSAASPLIPPPSSEIDLEAGAGDQLQCRICLETDGRDFIAPCKCKGTSKYVHRDCLDHWRAVKGVFGNALASVKSVDPASPSDSSVSPGAENVRPRFSLYFTWAPLVLSSSPIRFQIQRRKSGNPHRFLHP